MRTLSIGLMKCGRAKWQEAEATRRDFNIVLTRQDKKFFTSELFKVIQDAIPLILHYRTMFKFRTWKDNWMKELDSEVAGSSKDTQRIQPKPKTQLSRTVRPVGEQQFTQEIGKDVLFGREGTKHSTRTGRPVDGPKSIQSCVSMPVELVDKYEDKDEDVDADQTRTVRPEGGQESTQLEEIDIDFRIPGLSHAIVKEAENFRVQELVKKIESHPHREALQADLQQNNVYDPFSNNLKEMVRELGNVELFELCETIPKVQCSQCLLYWNQGMICCTCGQFLVESESRRKLNKLRLDALSIPHYVIKKRALPWCSTR